MNEELDKNKKEIEITQKQVTIERNRLATILNAINEAQLQKENMEVEVQEAKKSIEEISEQKQVIQQELFSVKALSIRAIEELKNHTNELAKLKVDVVSLEQEKKKQSDDIKLQAENAALVIQARIADLIAQESVLSKAITDKKREKEIIENDVVGLNAEKISIEAEIVTKQGMVMVAEKAASLAMRHKEDEKKLRVMEELRKEEILTETEGILQKKSIAEKELLEIQEDTKLALADREITLKENARLESIHDEYKGEWNLITQEKFSLGAVRQNLDEREKDLRARYKASGVEW